MITESKPVAYAAENEDRAYIAELASALEVTPVYGVPKETDGAFLQIDKGGLMLSGDGLSLRGDFRKMLPRLKINNLRGELLIRAAKPGNFGDFPTAVDATAGMGEDSFLLAASGFAVTLFEYNPIIAALLRDSLRRAADIPALAEIVGRMKLVGGNSIDEMPCMSFKPDIIVLDPMFPERRKSGLVKKKFQVIHLIEQPCRDENGLLEAAVAAHPRKIVIKRPSKGEYLAGKKPDYSIEGNGIRYDCFVNP